MNVFDFAMQMEVDGKHFYEQLAAEADDAGLRTIFLRLAADEQKHFEIFQALKGEVQKTTMEDSTILEDARNVFADLLENRGEFLSTLTVDLQGYRQAMKIEADSVRFYEDAARRETREEVKSLLLRIAAEEQKHFAVMENVYHFCNAPNQYLAWREFSNLDEFRQFGREVDS